MSERVGFRLLRLHKGESQRAEAAARLKEHFAAREVAWDMRLFGLVVHGRFPIGFEQ